eukprot:6760673-Pyramimonas_sp.AAC.1
MDQTSTSRPSSSALAWMAPIQVPLPAFPRHEVERPVDASIGTGWGLGGGLGELVQVVGAATCVRCPGVLLLAR